MKQVSRSIIFLHGKQSTPEGSGSARAVIEHFSPDHTVLVPDYRPMERTHEEIEEFLTDLISVNPGALIVGISLGGYWAHRMICILPQELGLAGVLLNPYFFNYPDVEIPTLPDGARLSVLVNLDDDLINPPVVLKRFAGRAKIVTSATGGHRFANKQPIVDAVRDSLYD